MNEEFVKQETKKRGNPNWVKGKSANPNGRPRKDCSVLEAIRAKLKSVCEYDTKGRLWLDAIADAELRFALTDTAARRDLLDRLLGKPVEIVKGIQQLDVTLTTRELTDEELGVIAAERIIADARRSSSGIATAPDSKA